VHLQPGCVPGRRMASSVGPFCGSQASVLENQLCESLMVYKCITYSKPAKAAKIEHNNVMHSS
jgi:hypothetical protein